MLTHERLLEVLDYDSLTGIFKWRISKARRVCAGDIAGHKDQLGYIIIVIDQKYYKAHRLAWFYITGELPQQHIDHKNRVRDDNRLNNLRLATRFQQRVNSKTIRNGLKGAWRNGNKWSAEIRANGEKRYLGIFDTELEAHEAYCQAARELHGEFACVN